MKCIGSGIFSKVYLQDDGSVLKVYRDCAYNHFLDFCKGYGHSPHLPTVYYSTDSQCCLERLLPIADEEVACRQEEAADAWYTKKDIKPWLGTSLSFDTTLHALEAYYDGNALEEKGYRWDLHNKNIMQRLDGVLVIIDPWAVDEYKC